MLCVAGEIDNACGDRYEDLVEEWMRSGECCVEIPTFLRRRVGSPKVPNDCAERLYRKSRCDVSRHAEVSCSVVVWEDADSDRGWRRNRMLDEL